MPGAQVVEGVEDVASAQSFESAEFLDNFRVFVEVNLGPDFLEALLVHELLLVPVLVFLVSLDQLHHPGDFTFNCVLQLFVVQVVLVLGKQFLQGPRLACLPNVVNLAHQFLQFLLHLLQLSQLVVNGS